MTELLVNLVIVAAVVALVLFGVAMYKINVANSRANDRRCAAEQPSDDANQGPDVTAWWHSVRTLDEEATDAA